MLEESQEKLPETQASRSCTILRYNYQQIDRNGEQLWQTESVFLFDDPDIKKMPIRVVGEIDLSNHKMTTDQIDAVLKTLYKYRELFSAPYPVVNLGGDNAVLSGEYVDIKDPAAGKELAYALVNKYNWTIVFKEV